MLEAVKEDQKELPKAPKPLKIRVEPIRPTQVVEVWRLYRRYVREEVKYPDLTEVSDDALQSHLFNYLQNPLFQGLMAKIGKRTVGIILGNLQARPYGAPSRFLNLECLWVDPNYHDHGVGQHLWNEYSERFKKAGVFTFESKMPILHLGQAKALQTVWGGRL